MYFPSVRAPIPERPSRRSGELEAKKSAMADGTTMPNKCRDATMFVYCRRVCNLGVKYPFHSAIIWFHLVSSMIHLDVLFSKMHLFKWPVDAIIASGGVLNTATEKPCHCITSRGANTLSSCTGMPSSLSGTRS